MKTLCLHYANFSHNIIQNNMVISLKTIIEVPAVLAAFANIYLAARASMWNWLFGIFAVILYGIIFYQTRLYGDMSLQAVYLFFQFYGWRQWKFGGARASLLSVTRMPQSQCYILGIILFILYGVFYYLLSRYTNSTTPYIDAFTTALSLIAQWMMCKKWLENWLAWILLDVISLYMYTYKHLYL
ncbi:MAG TPA: nicotinamide riboside transporter PnuC, partial [Gammaproteobacteria bacterium]|nr:nicotinamide riboside transporter PnuC [Gammaproteobacteria bacterium]